MPATTEKAIELADKHPFEPVPAAAAPAVTPVTSPVAAAATPLTADKPAATPEAAAAAFPRYAEGLGASPIVPHKVKTQTISGMSDLTDAIAKNSDLSKAELPTARSTAAALIEESGAAGITNLNQVAYELATARRESHMGNWMNEFGGNTYFENRYGYKTKKGKELGNTQPHDGANFHGRGLVQLTGRTNYTDWTDRLADENYTHNGQAVDLVNNPSLAADPHIAARIAAVGMRDGTFTKTHKLSDYINDEKTDYLHARRIINGMDSAQEIADQARTYQHILEKNSGAFADGILKGQLRNLPTAQDGNHLTAPTVTSEMFNPAPLGAGNSKFESPLKLLKNNIGHFTPSAEPAKFTPLKAHKVE
jgi:predicted chitinase